MENKHKHYALGLTCLFLTIGAFTASHHEMWRDEIQAWLLARDSTSVLNLFANLKYEGHPGLWHLCLMPLSRITHSPVIMQMFHLLITSVTVYLFVRYAPFNWFQKLLFCFGYFVLYEYAIVARNYALGMLLITIFCVLFKERYKHFIWVSCVLFLLAHTSVHALIVTIAIGFALCCEYVFSSRVSKSLNREIGAIGDKRPLWIGFSLIGVGITTAVLQLNPPPDTGFAVTWHLNYDVQRVNNILKLISQAYLPVTRPISDFWGSNLLTTYPFFLTIQIPLCYFLMLFSVSLFLKRPTTLLIYLIGTFGLLTFFYVKYHGSIRHHGFLFLTFLMCCWIYQDSPTINFGKTEQEDSDSGAERVLNVAGTVILTLLLICHAIGGIIATRMEYRHVFSYGKLTAEYIKSQGMQDYLMVGQNDFAAVTVVGYLQKPKIYYPRGHRFGSFIRWDKVRTHNVPNERVIEEAQKLSREHSQAVLIILNSALGAKLCKQHNLSFLAEFTGSVIGNANYYLYLMPLF
ncbi:hypothetical protein F4054_10630 [Candidatus Poribacteria bacterium]|nr:hypothetical protein [Candidatus Poribacteria bacterium]MYG05264.1 hypothetical protein [Candidatus Poribacteria bacterium]MYK22701.1 hypothetical protein [Candidatus Poribacteria bacterium]